MIEIMKLSPENIGIAFSCTKDNGKWGQNEHIKCNDFLINNLHKELYAYGVLYDKEPAGHAIAVDTESPYSMIDSINGILISCIYISVDHRNSKIGSTLLNYIEKEFADLNKNIFYVMTENNEVFSNFMQMNGFDMKEMDENTIVFYKFTDKSRAFKLKEFKDLSETSQKLNTLVINYNPFCPNNFCKCSSIAKIVKENFNYVKVEENFNIIDNKNKDDIYRYGVFFNGIPLIVNPNRPKEIINIINNLSIK